MIIHINLRQLSCVIAMTGLIAGCASTDPPPLPPGSPTYPQARESARAARSVLFADATTQAVTERLKQTASEAEKMPGMEHGDMRHGEMQEMQHEGMKMDGQGKTKQGGEMQGHEGMQHEGMEHGTDAQPDKKALADEMKKTSDEMKKTSDVMKEKSEAMQADAPVYTCSMHPEVKQNRPGKCPICGMTLIKKEGGQ